VCDGALVGSARLGVVARAAPVLGGDERGVAGEPLEVLRRVLGGEQRRVGRLEPVDPLLVEHATAHALVQRPRLGEALQPFVEHARRGQQRSQVLQEVVVRGHLPVGAVRVSSEHGVRRVDVRQPLRGPARVGAHGRLDRRLARLRVEREAGHRVPARIARRHRGHRALGATVRLLVVAEVPGRQREHRIDAPAARPEPLRFERRAPRVLELQARVGGRGAPVRREHTGRRRVHREGERRLGEIEVDGRILRASARGLGLALDARAEQRVVAGRGIRSTDEALRPGVEVHGARARCEPLLDDGQRLRARILLAEPGQRGDEEVALLHLHRHAQRLDDEVDRLLGVRLGQRTARDLRELDVEPEQREPQEIDLVEIAVAHGALEELAAHDAVGRAVDLLDRGAIRRLAAGDALRRRAIGRRRRRRRRTVLGALAHGREHRGRVERVVDVVRLRAVELDADVPRRDALAVEELVVEQRLDRDVLAARDGAESGAGDAVALLVVVARIVAVDRGDHAHVGRVQRGDVRLAVTHAGVVLARDLAIHVHADQDRALRLARDGQRVVPRALPRDQARLLPVLHRGRVPHLLARDALRQAADRAARLLCCGAGRRLLRGRGGERRVEERDEDERELRALCVHENRGGTDERQR